MMQLDYFSILGRQKHNFNLSQQMQMDIDQAETLLEHMWFIVNPLSEYSITKANLFDFLLLLMFNIGHQTEKKVENLLAKYLHDLYIKHNYLGYINTDPTLPSTNPLNLLSTLPNISDLSSNSDLLSKLQCFLHRLNPSSWISLHSVISTFKQEHKQRFTQRMQYFNSKERSREIMSR